MEGIEPWTFCTHKDADEKLAQSGPCPYHDALAYCVKCAMFLFNKREVKQHQIFKHYIVNIKH